MFYMFFSGLSNYLATANPLKQGRSKNIKTHTIRNLCFALEDNNKILDTKHSPSNGTTKISQ